MLCPLAPAEGDVAELGGSCRPSGAAPALSPLGRSVNRCWAGAAQLPATPRAESISDSSGGCDGIDGCSSAATVLSPCRSAVPSSLCV